MYREIYAGSEPMRMPARGDRTYITRHCSYKDHRNHDAKEHYNHYRVDEAEPVDSLDCPTGCNCECLLSFWTSRHSLDRRCANSCPSVSPMVYLIPGRCWTVSQATHTKLSTHAPGHAIRVSDSIGIFFTEDKFLFVRTCDACRVAALVSAIASNQSRMMYY